MNENFDVRQLRRSRSERIVAGVCGGLAEYFSVDPNLIRIVFVVVSFFGGAGLLLYIAGWVLLPEAGEAQSIAQRMASQYGRR